MATLKPKLSKAVQRQLAAITDLCSPGLEADLRTRIDGIYKLLPALEAAVKESPVLDRYALGITFRLHNIMCKHFGEEAVNGATLRLSDVAAVPLETWRNYPGFGDGTAKELQKLLKTHKGNAVYVSYFIR